MKNKLKICLQAFLLSSLTSSCGQIKTSAVEEVYSACTISPADEVWLNRAFDASMETARFIGVDLNLESTRIVVFDADCVVTSSEKQERTYTPHTGTVDLPIGTIAAQIISFAAPNPSGGSFFVMALPSVWKESGFEAELSVEDFTLGVFAHELSHIWQLETIMAPITDLPMIEALPPPVNDDIVQRLFNDNLDFANSLATEIKMFQEAAKMDDEKAARCLAAKARDQMKARWATYFINDYSALSGAQDIFLTLEGSGQWFAIHTLSAVPSGPKINRLDAATYFGNKGGKWSQDFGYAIISVLNRFDKSWSKSVYGDNGRSILSLLDAILINTNLIDTNCLD